MPGFLKIKMYHHHYACLYDACGTCMEVRGLLHGSGEGPIATEYLTGLMWEAGNWTQALLVPWQVLTYGATA